MTRTSQIALAASVALGAFLINDHMSLTQQSRLISSAEARIGRPLSPMSVAGVTRRHNRRAWYGAGVYGAGVYGAGVYGGIYRNGWNRYGWYRGGFVATGGALAIARASENWGTYGYTDWADYKRRNAIVCDPGNYFTMGGQEYLCQ